METKYFSIDTLINLIGEDPTMLIDMLQNIVKGTFEKYKLINEHFSACQWSLVKDNAHSLKSNLRYLGNQNMTLLMKTIELNILDDSKRIEMQEMMDDFNSTLPNIIKEVEEYVNFLKNQHS